MDSLLDSLPYTEVFGKVACFVTSKLLGIGERERFWKFAKCQRLGQRAHLGSEKTKIQATKHAEMREVNSQKSDKLWDDDDFQNLKLNHYCSGTILGQIKLLSLSGLEREVGDDAV